MEHFIAKHGGKAPVNAAALEALGTYPWRGNVRELENVIERALIISRGEPIGLEHLPEELRLLKEDPRRPLSLEEMEQWHIIRVLRSARDLDEAARILGIDPAPLWRKRKKYGIQELAGPSRE